MKKGKEITVKRSGPPDIAKLKREANVITLDGKKITVPENGSLGLLAIGYRGLFAWRAKMNKTKI